MSTFQSYFQRVLQSARNPSSILSSAQSTATSAAQQPQNLLQRARNMDTAQLVGLGVVGAELLGFFTVGEMIGRMKLIGYRGETGAHH